MMNNFFVPKTYTNSNEFSKLLKNLKEINDKIMNLAQIKLIAIFCIPGPEEGQVMDLMKKAILLKKENLIEFSIRKFLTQRNNISNSEIEFEDILIDQTYHFELLTSFSFLLEEKIIKCGKD